jgi:hypothetical protein
VRRGASWTADQHLQLTVAAVAGSVLVVLAAELSWLVGGPEAAARWSVQPASSGRALSPWSVRPGHLPWRRSASSMWCPPIRFRRPGSGGPAVRCPAVWRPACPVSSPSGVRPSGVRPSGVHPSGGQPAAVRPRRSGRVRLIPPRAVALWTRSVRRATCTTGTVEVPVGVTPWSGSVDGRAGPDADDAAGVAHWSVGGRWRTRAGLGEGGGRA